MTKEDSIAEDVVCRGSYTLGSACGRCSRCETELLQLVGSLMHDDACSYDHHGYCQAHSLHEKPCPHEVAQSIKKNLRRWPGEH